ncbi:MAG: hypothetical protein Q4F00_07590 [bacterium]|nr:hypothetical protein [bacterium]
MKLSLRKAGVNWEGETKVWSLPLYAVHRLRECFLETADGD